MVNPKVGKSKTGEKMHYSVGAIIRNKNKILMIDRKNPPFGFACVAGHVDESEKPEHALVREVREESGFEVIDYKLLLEEEFHGDGCKSGFNIHYWYVFNCEVKGELKKESSEEKSIDFYSISEIKKMKLENAWKYFFEKLKII